MSVCSHRFGADMTYTEQSDSYSVNASPENTRDTMEYYAHKYGARLGVFAGYDRTDWYGGKEDIVATEKYGIIKYDQYFMGYLWWNPNTDVIEWIPDFERRTWSQAGIDAFGYIEDGVTKINGEEVHVGSPKEPNSPGHGISIYQYSNGKYGWDAHGNFGQSHAEEFFKVLNLQVEGFKENITGRYASCISYGYGSNTAKNVMPSKYLGARNSNGATILPNNTAQTWYGKDMNGNYLGYPQKNLTREDMCNRNSSTRWWDSVKAGYCTKAEILVYLKNLAGVTAANHGWQNNFTHWQSCKNADDPNMYIGAYDDYWAALQEGFNGAKVHYCNYGEAVEYMVFRNDIDKVSAFTKGNNVMVAVRVKDKFKGDTIPPLSTPTTLPEMRITTPISIEVDLSGSILSGKNIKTSFGFLFNKGNNKYIVEVPYPIDNNNMSAIILSEAQSANYDSISLPVISNVVVSGTTVTFDTNMPCYSEVFEKTDVNNVSRYGDRYIDELKTHHSVKIGTNQSKSYAIGVISKTGITNLYNLYN